jgi:hypothetical protein
MDGTPYVRFSTGTSASAMRQLINQYDLKINCA